MKPKTRQELNQLRHEETQRLTTLIETLPAGWLSGGARLYDQSDKATWWASDDPSERAFARDYLGVTGPEAKEGLSHSEKRTLYRAVDDEVAGITPQTIKAAKKQIKTDGALMDRAWGVYQSRFPDTAQGDFAAVGEAGARLMQQYPVETIRALAEHDPVQLADMLANEVAIPGYHGGTTVANRGAAVFGGYARPAPAEQPETSMFDDLRDWQIKHKFHG